MQKISERIKYWGQLLLLPVYGFSFLFPRNKNIWLFGSTFGRRFADNPRYFYLYVNQHSDKTSDQVKTSVEKWKAEGHTFTEDEQCKDIRPIWISHNKEIVEFLNDKGYEAYYYHSLKGIWYSLRGKVYCFDNYSKDISFWLSGGAVKFNMWHGIPLKKIQADNIFDKVRHPKNRWEKIKSFPRRLSDEKPSHYILTTSPMMSEIFSRAFQIPMDHVIEAGYPRNDILFEDTNHLQQASDNNVYIKNLYLPEEQKLMEYISSWRERGWKIVGYLPTFRPSENQLFEACDLQQLNGFFQEHDMIMVCKLHPKSSCKQAFEKIEYSNIYVVPAEVDVNAFLEKIDILIADYSSVYSDYMLLDRPVVAFHYDYEEYAKDTRDAYFDWDEYMPEKRVSDEEELQQVILDVLEEDVSLESRQKFRRKLFEDEDGEASRRVLQALKNLI